MSADPVPSNRDQWRYVCLECDKLNWKYRAQLSRYYCNECGPISKLRDKKTGELTDLNHAARSRRSSS